MIENFITSYKRDEINRTYDFFVIGYPITKIRKKMHTQNKKCREITENGKKCKEKGIYMGYCGKHVRNHVDSTTSIIPAIKSKIYSLIYILLKECKVDPNKKEDGKTLLHILVSNPELDEDGAIMSLLIESGADVNLKSTDTVIINGKEHKDMEISPLFYTLFSNASDTVKNYFFEELHRWKDLRIEESFKGKHLIFYVLESLNVRLVQYFIHENLHKIYNFSQYQDEHGNNILHAYFLFLHNLATDYSLHPNKPKYFCKRPISAKTFDLFSQNDMLNTKNIKGETPFHILFKTWDICKDTQNFWLKLAPSILSWPGNTDKIIHKTAYCFYNIDITLIDNEGTSIMELEKFKEMSGNLDIDFVLKNIKEKTYGVRRDNIRSYLDIFFTLKLVGNHMKQYEHRRKIFCNLVMNKIDYFLKKSYSEL